jgi:hypothetical protein
VTDEERTYEARHPMGPGGRVDVTSPRGKLTVLGTDGPECRIEARYQDSSVAEAAGIDPDRIVRLSRGDDRLGIDVREGDLLAVDLRIEMPRTASVRIHTVSSEIEVRGLTGETRIRQVSGKARLFEMGGNLNLDTISGPITVEGTEVALQASTASGAISLDARRIDELELTTLSADVSLAGVLRPEGNFRIEAVSGDVRLVSPTGLTATFRSLSGRVVIDGAGRDEARRGERVVTLGDGRVPVQVRTVSGSLRLQGAGQPVNDGTDAAQPHVEDLLVTLMALERGEIDVDEASRRLGGTGGG